jgi:hypothetical protein
MGMFGNIIGGGLGQMIGGYAGGARGRDAGGTIGGTIGNLLPFKKGGRVPGKVGKPKVILAHGGEYVLPAGVKPTKAQKAEVAKRHRKK